MKMKKISYLLFACLAVIAIACQKDDDPVYTLTVTVSYPGSYSSNFAEGAWVYAAHSQSGRIELSPDKRRRYCSCHESFSRYIQHNRLQSLNSIRG